MASEKTVTKSYSIRLNDSIRARLISSADARSAVCGKKVPLSEIMIEALEYGLEVVDRDTSHQNALPFNVTSRTERLVKIARQIADAGSLAGIPATAA